MANMLVVDDDIRIRELLNKAFERNGHCVVTVPELAQALDRVRKEVFDLIILDLEMRGEQGAVFLRKIRETKSDVPIVIYSGMLTPESEIELRKAGANEVITKGGEISEIIQPVEQILKVGKRLFTASDREKTLLIVDDDELIRGLLVKFFSRKQYKVLEASNAQEGLAAVRREKINCVLLDVRMPDKNGLEILPELLAADPEIGVVMISGEGEEHIVKEAMSKGAYGYILKPFDFVYLELSVASKLAIAGSD